MKSILPFVVIVAAIGPTPTLAAVLTAGGENICTAIDDGKPAVDKDKLALAIVAEAQAVNFLDGANPGGVKNNSIDLQSVGATLSEPAYAVLNAGLVSPAKNNRPFGPDVDLNQNEQAAAARDAIDRIFREEIQFLTINGQIKVEGVNSQGIPTSTVYRIRRREDVVGAPQDERDWMSPELLFWENPPLVIVCEQISGSRGGASDGKPSPERPSPLALVSDHLRLRGTVTDLWIPFSELRTAEPAKISFNRDDRSKTETLQLNGVLGLAIGDDDGVYEAIPFISYETTQSEGGKASDDVEVLAPGIQLVHRLENPSFALHSRLETTYIADLEQNARQGKLRLYLDPAFALPSIRPESSERPSADEGAGPPSPSLGPGILFGSDLRAIGPLVLRPDLTVIGDASVVFDDGDSEQLGDASEYAGLGGEIKLRARLNMGQPISDFVLVGGKRSLWLFGDIDQSVADRWFAGVSYSPQNLPYIGVGFAYNKGQNDDTFQKIETLGVDLSLRY